MMPEHSVSFENDAIVDYNWSAAISQLLSLCFPET